MAACVRDDNNDFLFGSCRCGSECIFPPYIGVSNSGDDVNIA
jgi:hypothetical protein